MKERTKGLIAGILIATTIFGVTGTALAASGAITLNVTPVKVKVNNEVFQPKDVNGNNVLVFVHNGTTYAPLRALAEAYGLEVGWDQASGTATVIDPEKVQDSSSATSAGGASAEDIERWTAGKVDTPDLVSIKVIKIDDKYYMLDGNLNQRNYMLTYDNGVPLVFAEDIVVTYDDWCTSWYLLNMMSQALMTDFTITETDNPFFDGTITKSVPGRNEIVTAGKEPDQYLSATTKYTPMWIEYNGVKVYNAPKQNGFYAKDGIRYYNGRICCNDVLAKLRIDKSFAIGTYQDLLYFEWE